MSKKNELRVKLEEANYRQSFLLDRTREADAEIAALEASIAEEVKPELRHGDYGQYA